PWPRHPRHSPPRCFFFTPPAPSELFTLSLHDALPIYRQPLECILDPVDGARHAGGGSADDRAEHHVRSERTSTGLRKWGHMEDRDRKSTRLNSSHVKISYAVFCLKKKSDGPAETTTRR